MIYKEAASDGRAGMDLDAGQKAAELRDDSRQIFEAMQPEPVGDIMRPQRMDSGIGQGLPSASRRRVFGEHGINIFTKSSEHVRASLTHLSASGGGTKPDAYLLNHSVAFYF